MKAALRDALLREHGRTIMAADLPADAYDFLMGWLRHPEKEAAFLASIVGSAAILDAGCGTGSTATELAKMGLSVTGIDISPEYLRQAKKRADGLSNVRFKQADLRQVLPFADATVPAIICLFSVFDIVAVESPPASILSEFRRIMPAGGTMIVDGIERSRHEARYNGGRWTAFGRHSIAGVDKYAVEVLLRPIREPHGLVSLHFNHRITCIGAEIVITTVHPQRIRSLAEWRDLLRDRGFELCRTWGGFKGDSFDAGDGDFMMAECRAI